MKAHVRLLNEGTDVWREVEVEKVEGHLYRLGGDEPEDEDWELKPGAIVRLVDKELSDGPALIAVAV